MRALRQCWVVAVSLLGMFAAGQSLEAQARRSFAGGVAAGGYQGLMLDLSKASSLYQDAARTTPVTSLDQGIGSPTDLSGNGNHPSQATAPSRPLWLGNRARFDGVDDCWRTEPIDFTGTDQVTIIASLTKRSNEGAGRVVELGAIYNVVGGRFVMLAVATVAATNTVGVGSMGSFARFKTITDAALAAPVTLVLAGVCEIDTDTLEVWVNGLLAGTDSGDQGTGTYSVNRLNIGARDNGVGQFLNADLYRLGVIGKRLSPAEFAVWHRWAAQPAGVVLP